jgi:hypothetical protein
MVRRDIGEIDMADRKTGKKPIRALVKEPGKHFEMKMIENDYEVLKEIVGGYIEAIHLPYGIMILCDEDGKLVGNRPFNVLIGPMVFVGTIVLVSIADGEFASLDDDQLEKAESILQKAEEDPFYEALNGRFGNGIT